MTREDCSHSWFLRSWKASVSVASSVLCVWYVEPFKRLLTLKHFIFASIAWTRGWQTFSVKCQTVNILGFVGPTASAGTAQLCCGYRSAAVDDMQTNELCCLSVKLCLRKHAVARTWPSRHVFLTPGIVYRPWGKSFRFDLQVLSCVTDPPFYQLYNGIRRRRNLLGFLWF